MSPVDGPLASVSVGIAVLTSVLAWYSWGRRREQGANELAVASAIAALWSVASLMQALSTEPEVRILWYQATIALLLPMVCAVTAFVLHYGGLRRHLTPARRWWALVVPSVLELVLVITNPAHGLMWADAVVDPSGAVRLDVTALGWLGLGYYTVLGLLNLTVLARLILISPTRRVPAALMLLAHLVSRYAFAHDVFGWQFPLPVSPGVLTVGVPFATYAVALFGLRMFDPVPAARRAALEQMSDGVVVVDAAGAVIEANPAAVRILGRAVSEIRGRPIGDLLPENPPARPGDPGVEQFDLDLGAGESRRHHVVARSALMDESGRKVGQLYLVQDVTDRLKAQERLLENHQELARFTEREHLARDLHDSVGQVLGFVSMQAQAIRKRLVDGEVERAEQMLDRLAEVAQQAHDDVRGLILSLTSPADSSAPASIPVSLREQLRDFEATHGIRADLAVEEGTLEGLPDADAGAQVLRVVQEALTNVRRHSGAAAVRVAVTRSGDGVRVTIEDDGHGFDRDDLAVDRSGQFGLAIMRERMEDVGGILRVESAPGRGTRVTVEVPVPGPEGVE